MLLLTSGVGAYSQRITIVNRLLTWTARCASQKNVMQVPIRTRLCFELKRAGREVSTNDGILADSVTIRVVPQEDDDVVILDSGRDFQTDAWADCVPAQVAAAATTSRSTHWPSTLIRKRLWNR